eukprot:TCALIF_13389-PA protein Name:"Protein of unknown function" AED:0.33 eAED:0.33 QI:0/0/0/0.66/1/1/3/0/724
MQNPDNIQLVLSGCAEYRDLIHEFTCICEKVSQGGPYYLEGLNEFDLWASEKIGAADDFLDSMNLWICDNQDQKRSPPSNLFDAKSYEAPKALINDKPKIGSEAKQQQIRPELTGSITKEIEDSIKDGTKYEKLMINNPAKDAKSDNNFKDGAKDKAHDGHEDLAKYVEKAQPKTTEVAGPDEQRTFQGTITSLLQQQMETNRLLLARQDQIRPEDFVALDNYATFLTSCLNAMTDVVYLDKLNNVDTLREVIAKLPNDMQKRWRKESYVIRTTKNRLVKFKDVFRFIQEEAEVLGDPVFGIVNHSHHTNDRDKKSYSMATTVMPQIAANSSPASNSNGACFFCQGSNHIIDSCFQYEKLSLPERRDFVQEHSLCYGCLRPGHQSRFCTGKLKCKICSKLHPTMLHSPSLGTLTNSPVLKSSPISIGERVDGYRDICLAIVPVKVRIRGQIDFISTYAAQDPYSTATFMTEALANELNARGVKTKIMLTTMDRSNRELDTKIVVNVEVCDMEEENLLHLPPTYTRPSLPMTKQDIPSQNDIDKWDHLRSLPFRRLPAEVGLMIGINAPEALKPLEVIGGKAGDPYALRTSLGWSVNGPMHFKIAGSILNNCVQVTQSTENVIARIYNRDFDDKSPEAPGTSIEDGLFMKNVEKSICFKDERFWQRLASEMKTLKRGKPFPNTLPQVRCAKHRKKSSDLPNKSFWKTAKYWRSTIQTFTHSLRTV